MPCELLVRVVDKVHADPYLDVTMLKRGDVVVAVHHDDAKRVWDEMLARRRVSQAQYDASKRPDGTHRWPWSRGERGAAQWRIVETDISAAEAAALVAAEQGDVRVDPMLRRRLKRLDLAGTTVLDATTDDPRPIDAAVVRARVVDAPKIEDPGAL